MKKDLDQLFKDSLSDFEVPFNEMAWNSISSKLPKAKTAPWKTPLIWTAAISASVVGLSVFLLNTNSTEKTTQAVVKENAIQTAQNASTHSTELKNNTSNSVTVHKTTQTNSSSSGNQLAVVSDNSIVPNKTESSTRNIEVNQLASNEEVKPSKTENTPQEKEKEKEKSINKPLEPSKQNSVKQDDPVKLKLPVLPKVICLNESLKLNNVNTQDAQLVSPSGKRKIVHGDTKESYTLNEAGVYTYKIGSLTEKVEVVEPQNDLYIAVPANVDDMEDGIPYLKIDFNGNCSNLKWNTDGVAFEQKDRNTLILHPFKQKSFTITVQGEDQNGCIVSKKENITLRKRYNLNASEGFDPLDNRSDVATFMPEALTVRNTPFELTIRDVSTNELIYHTRNASDGWDGKDPRTGDLVPKNSRWIWKVTLFEPLQGEPSQYSGIIMRQDK